MSAYEVCVKSYKRCRSLEVSRLIRGMTAEQKRCALGAIHERAAMANLLGQGYDRQFLTGVLRRLRA